MPVSSLVSPELGDTTRATVRGQRVNYRFPRELRLAGKREIDEVFADGRTVSCPGLRLVWKGNDRDYSRIVISPTRRFKTAVGRNRVRRVLRETFRKYQHMITPGFDLAVVAYPGDYTGYDRARQLLRLLRTAGLIVITQRSEP